MGSPQARRRIGHWCSAELVDTVRPFTDPAAVASYAQSTPRRVPGYADLHRMAMMLLAERAPRGSNILVYGAGGGLELKAFADGQPGWRFVGVDPSAEMLNLARDVLGAHLERIDLLQGYISDVAQCHFDGATCLLTLHFLSLEERLAVLKGIHSRLKPGSSFVVAHHSCPVGDSPQTWLARSLAFASATARELAQASASARLLEERLPILSTEEEESLLSRAGFSNVALFYAALSFRGWVAVA
jgi:tRNA (cmo5U34)-methyltransferase